MIEAATAKYTVHYLFINFNDHVYFFLFPQNLLKTVELTTSLFRSQV